MAYKFATTENKEKTARALGSSLAISLKHSVEICEWIRNTPLEKAKQMLSEVAEKKRPVPFKRFNKDVGHKTDTGPGRFPEKASSAILKVVQHAEASAQFKGLNTGSLVLSHVIAQGGSRQFHSGRKRRRKMKRTHIEVILEEKKAK